MSQKLLNTKSHAITQGDRRAPNRAMLRAVGFSDEDFQKPIIGVANGQSDITPCNAGLGKLADIAADQIRKKGGMPKTKQKFPISNVQISAKYLVSHSRQHSAADVSRHEMPANGCWYYFKSRKTRV